MVNSFKGLTLGGSDDDAGSVVLHYNSAPYQVDNKDINERNSAHRENRPTHSHQNEFFSDEDGHAERGIRRQHNSGSTSRRKHHENQPEYSDKKNRGDNRTTVSHSEAKRHFIQELSNDEDGEDYRNNSRHASKPYRRSERSSGHRLNHSRDEMDEYDDRHDRHRKHTHSRRSKDRSSKHDEEKGYRRTRSKYSRESYSPERPKYQEGAPPHRSSKTRNRSFCESDSSERANLKNGHYSGSQNEAPLSNDTKKHSIKADRAPESSLNISDYSGMVNGVSRLQVSQQRGLEILCNVAAQLGFPIPGLSNTMEQDTINLTPNVLSQMGPGKSNYDFTSLLESLPAIDLGNDQVPAVVKPHYETPTSLCGLKMKEVETVRENNNITIITKGKTDTIFHPIPQFDIGIFPSYIQKYAAENGYISPTPIQMQAWPVLLSGYDLLGIAETGSGKTLAFLFPAFVHVMKQPLLRPGDGPICLIVTPTRELAIQIRDITSALSKLRSSRSDDSIRVFGCFGGERNDKPYVRGEAEIVVASPGKLLALLNRSSINLHRMSFLVIDETDRASKFRSFARESIENVRRLMMLASSFQPQVEGIVKCCLPDRQTVMFSATWDGTVDSIKSSICNSECVEIVIGREDKTRKYAAKNIKQRFVAVIDEEKQQCVEEAIRAVTEGKILIFCNTKMGARTLHYSLNQARLGLKVNAIHSDLDQNERNRVLDLFRTEQRTVLIATDLLSRGIDIGGIALVINFEYPFDSYTYIHRIGRCGRAGRRGSSLTLLNRYDKKKYWPQIEEIDPNATLE
ncbi:hypothetical protein IE077_000244 [Cardiosporidium cionae]|uniref:RNA helicase n=1 Tax=Cardiosporidium cionae TaxID=476202 RepID=A0ABQ7JC80_9APIC|nr:hypothetical protein IE077_000244 [Cardiosporidium cionae]|eukprot:KAF8821569.1 hypothetical protein IE077_000244 [Cardiosporidium cionae]